MCKKLFISAFVIDKFILGKLNLLKRGFVVELDGRDDKTV
jgi:hypothetical protein